MCVVMIFIAECILTTLSTFDCYYSKPEWIHFLPDYNQWVESLYFSCDRIFVLGDLMFIFNTI